MTDGATPGYGSATFLPLFASPLVSYILPNPAALNDALRESILAHEGVSEGRARSNAGGWHSEPGQLEFCGEAGRTLVRHMYGMADEATRRVLAEIGQSTRPLRWSLRAWVNVNRNGDYNRVHTHAGATWSGTYYVDSGMSPDDPAASAPILLFDPCQGHANTFLQPMMPLAFPVRPQPGLMILFPSYVPHMVDVHQGPRPRISIAFNLRKEPYP